MKQTSTEVESYGRLFGPLGRSLGLISVLLFEIVVWGSMRWYGWNESLRLGGLSGLLLISSIPLILATAMLLWSWRLSIRRMMIAVTLIAIFFAAFAVPYQRFLTERQAGYALFRAGAGTVPYERHLERRHYMQARYPLEPPIPGTFSPFALKTIAWLQPFLGKLPVDQHICEVTVDDDQQVNVLLAQANKLPNLRVIVFGESVTNAGRDLFSDSVSYFPNLLGASIGCSKDFQAESIRNIRGLKYFDFWTNSQQSPPLPNRLGKVVSRLGELDMVHISGLSVSPASFLEWEDADARLLTFWSMKPTLTKSDLCRFSHEAPNIELFVYPFPKR